MRTKQILSVMLALVILLIPFSISVSAENNYGAAENDEPILRYLYVYSVQDDFYITNGTAYVKVSYVGLTNVTTRAEISIKLQHRFLFWWFDVSGGEWNDTVYGVNGSVDHSLALTDAGDFRAVINVKVYGTGSGYDEINDTPTASN